MPECIHPRVGVGVFVMKDNKLLIGKRKGSHGSGTWQLPGGNLEFGESFESCAKREVLEETNLQIKNINFQTVTNVIMSDENLHYAGIFMRAEVVDKNVKPVVTEPHKCECWEWVTWDDFIKGGISGNENLRETNKYRPMFEPLKSLLLTKDSYRPDY